MQMTRTEDETLLGDWKHSKSRCPLSPQGWGEHDERATQGKIACLQCIAAAICLYHRNLFWKQTFLSGIPDHIKNFK